jgi:negative regulator of replication initiation
VKNVELSDEAYDRLQRIASARQQTPAEVLTSLLAEDDAAHDASLRAALRSREIAASSDPADRYLGLLSWVAKNHAADFADFISHQDSARRYLLLSRHEVNAIRQQHLTRQIDGTQYWAVMNIDCHTRTDFVRRLLEFIGCHDAAVSAVIHELGLDRSRSRPGPGWQNVA